MIRKLDTSPGQPDYELARAITNQRNGAGFFERSNNTWKSAYISHAREVIDLLEKTGYSIIHETSIDGG